MVPMIEALHPKGLVLYLMIGVDISQCGIIFMKQLNYFIVKINILLSPFWVNECKEDGEVALEKKIEIKNFGKLVMKKRKEKEKDREKIRELVLK